jgi:phosphorylcholine metabolism protein LicD
MWFFPAFWLSASPNSQELQWNDKIETKSKFIHKIIILQQFLKQAYGGNWLIFDFSRAA